MSIINVQELTKTYDTYRKQPGLAGTLRSFVRREKISVEAVRDVSFSIEEGEFVGFIGPNGAGKTTTLKMLSGILWPTSGEASVLGHTPWKRERAYQRQFAIVLGQKNQLWWDLPARDTFLLNKEIYEISDRDFHTRVKQLGEVLDATNVFDLPVRKLSLGERMKCELVNALLHRPKVLFLDEPTIGLDVVSQQAIREFLAAQNKKEGTTIILTSHAMADVQALCPRVIVIHTGRVQYDGALAALAERVADHKDITVTFSGHVQKKNLAGFGEVTKWTPERATIQVPRERLREVAKRLLDTLPVSDLLIEEIPIEEIVRRIFQDGA